MDVYTEKYLREAFGQFKNYNLGIEKRRDELNINLRLANFPEEISENIAKFIIRNRCNDPTIFWPKGVPDNQDAGDLRSDQFGKVEVKCFSTDSCSSFGPDEAWDMILFLDATGWRDDKFAMYSIVLKNTDSAWADIQISEGKRKSKRAKNMSKQPLTYQEQCEAGWRPRIEWKRLYPQITSNCTKVFDGTFDEVFVNIQQTQQGHSSVG